MSSQESHWPPPERPADYVAEHVAWGGMGADLVGVLARLAEVTIDE